MYSLFALPSRIERVNQENIKSARKPGLSAKKPGLSTRKPLGDRKLNLVTPPKENVKSKHVLKPKTPITPVDDFPEIDFCSGKEVQDNYDDLYDPEEFLGPKGIENILRCFTYENISSAPKPQFDSPKLDFIEIKRDFPTHEGLNANEISDLFMNDFKMPDLDPPFPDFSFNDSM